MNIHAPIETRFEGVHASTLNSSCKFSLPDAWGDAVGERFMFGYDPAMNRFVGASERATMLAAFFLRKALPGLKNLNHKIGTQLDYGFNDHGEVLIPKQYRQSFLDGTRPQKADFVLQGHGNYFLASLGPDKVDSRQRHNPFVLLEHGFQAIARL